MILRRKAASTVFASVCDVVANGKDASLRTLVPMRSDSGYGLESTLANGAMERVLVNFSANALTISGWSTDAGVAAVRQNGKTIEAFILSAGTSLTGPDCAIRLSAVAQISAYAVKDGLIRVTNHSDADVSVDWSGVNATQVATIDAAGAWVDCKPLSKGHFDIPAMSAVDLSTGGDETVAAFEAKQRRAKQQAAWETEQKRLATQAAEATTRMESPKRESVPANYSVMIEAEAITNQGGGAVTITDKKTAAHGTSITQWNERGHWLEYTCEIAHSGWYQVGLKYCLEGDDAIRALRLDGEYLHASLTSFTLPSTGGWSNGADQWSLVPICLPESETPMIVRLEKGKHVVRLESPAGGGLNVDYVVLAPATATMTRALVEK